MINWDAVVKQARDCHTKQAWEGFFREHGEGLASGANPKALADIYRILRADPQGLQYDPAIWGQLIRGCTAAWNLELGREIAEYTRKLPSTAVSLPAAKLYLDSGQPSTAREIANRTLRLSGLDPGVKLQLEMLIATSYAEEGKRPKAIKVLSQMRDELACPSMADRDRANLLMHMGRTYFHLGRYVLAAEVFYESSRFYRELSDWEAAATAIFNSAACHLNSGSRRREETFAQIEECRRLSEAHNLAGPLSHCEAAYGMDAYHHGDFAAAREHLRRALEHLPISDKSFRRLHILSMLAYAYLAMGRYHLARKFGNQTLDLASMDGSERFKIRYLTLHAELEWEDGRIEESQAMLRDAVQTLGSKGVHTLEELATQSRWLHQSALLDSVPATIRLDTDETLKRNHFAVLDRTVAEGQMALTQGQFDNAERTFSDCLRKSREIGDRFHEATGLLGLIQTRLAQRNVRATDAPFRDFEVVVARMGETPLKCQVLLLDAARAYQSGDFPETQRLIRLAGRSTRQGFADRFALSVWEATIDGRSPRLQADWQAQLVARSTRIYFAPVLEVVDSRHFLVSGHYMVSLERHPLLAELLQYLLMKNSFEAETTEIQTQVWRESLNNQGWRQKIRNTIMRLRDFFPYTMAPLILHADQVALFKAAISLQPPRREGFDADTEILRLLRDTPLSSQQLASRLNVSVATTKRLLKKMADDRLVSPCKSGRNVVYQVTGGEAAPT